MKKKKERKKSLDKFNCETRACNDSSDVLDLLDFFQLFRLFINLYQVDAYMFLLFLKEYAIPYS